jgi:hypothetical protein
MDVINPAAVHHGVVTVRLTVVVGDIILTDVDRNNPSPPI